MSLINEPVLIPFPHLLDEEGREPWEDRALCAQTDPEAFYPEKGGSSREAKRVCRACEVRAECLEYALAHTGLGQGGGYPVGAHGIWGGLSERERRRLNRQAA